MAAEDLSGTMELSLLVSQARAATEKLAARLKDTEHVHARKCAENAAQAVLTCEKTLKEGHPSSG